MPCIFWGKNIAVNLLSQDLKISSMNICLGLKSLAVVIGRQWLQYNIRNIGNNNIKVICKVAVT